MMTELSYAVSAGYAMVAVCCMQTLVPAAGSRTVSALWAATHYHLLIMWHACNMMSTLAESMGHNPLAVWNCSTPKWQLGHAMCLTVPLH
jgi:hypothetical protein